MTTTNSLIRVRGYDPTAAADWGARVAAADRRERDRLAHVEVDPYTGVAREPAPVEAPASPEAWPERIRALSRAVLRHVGEAAQVHCWLDTTLGLFGRYAVAMRCARVEIDARLLDEPEYAGALEPIAKAIAQLGGGSPSVALPANVALENDGKTPSGRAVWRFYPCTAPATPAVDEAAFLRHVRNFVPLGVPANLGESGPEYLTVIVGGSLGPWGRFEVERALLADHEGAVSAAACIGSCCSRTAKPPFAHNGVGVRTHPTRDAWVVARVATPTWP